jgi:hypothetical protein
LFIKNDKVTRDEPIFFRRLGNATSLQQGSKPWQQEEEGNEKKEEGRKEKKRKDSTGPAH